MKRKKICLTGGGTAGHIMPNIAIYEHLFNKYDFFYIGAHNSMEEKLITPIMPFFCAPNIKKKNKQAVNECKNDKLRHINAYIFTPKKIS